MIKIIPTPVVGAISNKHKTISPNQHYAAYITDGIFNSKKINIINLKNKTKIMNLWLDFQYSIFCVFKELKIYQITFNNESDTLYFLAKKSQYNKLYQFKLYKNSNQPPSKQWYKDKTIFLSFDVKSFVINETTQELHLVGFTGRQVNYKVLQINTQELITKNIEKVYSNITKIKLDPTNMQLSALSKKGEFRNFSITCGKY